MNAKLIHNLLTHALQKQGECCLTVMGESMLPTLQIGDVVKVVSTYFEELQLGQIIAVMVDETIIIHRIRHVTPTGYITYGDNNILCDYPIEKKNYIGLVSAKKMPNGDFLSLNNDIRISITQRGGSTEYITKVFLDNKFYNSIEMREWGWKLHPVSQFSNSPSFESIGISPFGLNAPIDLFNDLKVKPNLQLICLVNFGPDRFHKTYFPITSVKYVVRLDFFDYWEQWSSNLPLLTMMFLSYLQAFISASRIS